MFQIYGILIRNFFVNVRGRVLASLLLSNSLRLYVAWWRHIAKAQFPPRHQESSPEHTHTHTHTKQPSVPAHTAATPPHLIHIRWLQTLIRHHHSPPWALVHITKQWEGTVREWLETGSNEHESKLTTMWTHQAKKMFEFLMKSCLVEPIKLDLSKNY